MNKINVQEYLHENCKGEYGCYAIIKYNNTQEAIWFAKIKDDINGNWFLESPCILQEEYIFKDEKDLCEYVECIYDDKRIELGNFIGECIYPMVRGNILYNIDNPQCAPFLPEELDSVEIISEGACLDYLLKEYNK